MPASNRPCEQGERICIYGDYRRADGVTSTTVLCCLYSTSRGARCTYFIPDRLSEGVRPRPARPSNGLRPDVDLIITVDTGITAAEETAFAASLGVDMIITDHHSCRPVLPQAAAVVNPHRPDSAYPFRQLAGVGVVFKLLCALEGDTEAVCRRFADLVAIGTIADVMPLTDENRLIASVGLERLRRTENVGLRALMTHARRRQAGRRAEAHHQQHRRLCARATDERGRPHRQRLPRRRAAALPRRPAGRRHRRRAVRGR